MVKRISTVLFLFFIILTSMYLYLGYVKRETKTLCESLSIKNGMSLDAAITLAKNKSFTVTTGSNNGTQALFFKLSTVPGLCIGKHKNGLLYNVKYHPHT